MRLLECFDPGPRGAWLILTVSLQVAAVILAAAFLSRTILRWRAAMRHCVWLSALVCTLLGPAAVILAEYAGLTRPILPRTRVAVEADTAAEVNAPVETEAQAVSEPEAPAIADFDRAGSEKPSTDRIVAVGDEGPSVARPPSSEGVIRESAPPQAAEMGDSLGTVDRVHELLPRDRRNRPALAPLSRPQPDRPSKNAVVGSLMLVWALGVLIGLARFGVGWRRLVRLRGTFQPFDSADLAGALRDVRAALGNVEPPPIVTSPAVARPIVVGVLRPRVVFPQALAATLTGRQLRDALLHECAHILRGDTLVGLLQQLVAALYWPHLLVHHMNAQLSRAREEVCDNFALRDGDPCGYARTLLELTERCRPASAAACDGVGLMDTRWTLRDRVAGLLDPRRNVMTKPHRGAASPAILLLAATCVSLAGIRPAALSEAGARPPRNNGAEALAEPPERRIRGVVVDEGGRPVAGATVRPVRKEKAPRPAMTDDDGRFTLNIGGLMLMEEDLVASADDGARLGLGTHVEPKSSRPAEPVRIVLKPSRSITVRVQNADGQPVAGAAVEAFGFDDQDSATTDADGDATLRIPAGAEVRWVIGLKPGVGFDYFENYDSTPASEFGPPPAEVTLTLDGARTVRIKAVDSAGRPVPDVAFRPSGITKPGKIDDANLSGAGIARARTDERGVATFDWLPTEVDGVVAFDVSPGAYSCPDSPIDRSAADAGERELTARLLRATEIRGVVRDADGRPAAGILLRAEGRGATNHYCRMQTRTRDDGSYRFEVDPEQSYIIAVLDDRRAARSLTGIVVREGQPRDGLDITLGEGTLLRGRVTKEPDATPVAGETITLVQRGEPLPREFVSPRGGDEVENLVRWAVTDEEGRYRLRIGPGRYVLSGSDYREREELTVEDEAEVVRDFQIVDEARQRPLEGIAVERHPAGERPIPEAIVEASPVGRGGYESRAIADDAGRFQLIVNPDRDLVLYTRDRAGTLAGFTAIPAEADDARAFATPAARLFGRVVDSQGRPQEGRRIQLRLESAPDYEESGNFVTQTFTDSEGRYDFRGVVVGALAEVSVSHHEDPRLGNRLEVERLDVRVPDPIEVPDLVVPAAEGDAEAAEAPAARRPRLDPEAIARVSRPAAPTRAELEGLIRAIGRDPATPDLVDRAWLLTRPQFRWSVDLGRVESLVTDPDFTNRVDEAARAVLGRPADSLTLLRQARSYHVGYDLEIMKSFISRWTQAAEPPVPSVKGVVVEAETGRPIAGAIVYTSDALARTDDTGAFRLIPERPQREGMIWVEADGYALTEYPAFEAAGEPVDVRVELVREEPITGYVVGPDGQPISGATARASVKHYEFRVPRPDPAPRSDSYGFPLDVRTDAEGRFALRGLPPGLTFRFEVRHPESLTLHAAGDSLKRGAPNTFRLEPGCEVAGLVVDERGRGLSGARVEIRDFDRSAIRHRTFTAPDGRFRFGNVAPGRWLVVIQPERHAPILGPVVATLERPVENQYVAGPGAEISGRVIGPDGEPVARAAVGWARPIDERGLPIAGLSLNRITRTAEDGTFRLGPLPQGEYRLMSTVWEPRRLRGEANARSNQPDVVIRLEPERRD